ncbi:MAG: CinA family protein [Epsilonproteobacteria bacterium]|nr:CinA family protein [Campylobacterota bacterium]
MKSAVLLVGKEFINNKAFSEYVLREVSKKVLGIETITYLNDKDKDLFLQLSIAVEEYSNLLIVTSFESYPIASKIIATLFEDHLVLKEEMLVPSKTQLVTRDSFLLEEERKQVNLIRAKVGQKLPEILLYSDRESVTMFIFNLDKENILKRLLPLAKSYEVSFTLTQETQDLFKVCADNKKFGDLEMFVNEAKEEFKKELIVTPSLFEYLIERFSSKHKTVTFAESCTGGLLASMLTATPGASEIFDGSVVAYSNEIKQQWLGVKIDTLWAFGAVSEEVVEEMLKGALKKAQADYAIAISGVAGPGGGSDNKPVGTVVVGAGNEEREIIRTIHLDGDRKYIQYQSAMYGIKLLFELAHEELF